MAFRCDATTEIALGHLKRCLSLAEAFQEKGRASAFLCYNDPATREILSDLKHPTIWLPNTINQGNDAEATKSALTDLGIDTVIVDSYDIDAGYFDLLRHAGLRIIYFEDEAKTDWNVDAVINGVFGAEGLNYAAPLALLGPDYLVLGRDYWNGGGNRKQETDPLGIIITMGGIDHYDLTSRAISLLDGMEGPFKIHAVIGPYYENTKEIETAEGTCRHETILHHQPAGLAPLIRQCHAAVSAGGLTLYELAAMGVPAIGVWLWENQRRNTEQLGKMGAILPLAYEEGSGFDGKLASAVDVLVHDTGKRDAMRLAGLTAVDGQGALRVADALME